MKIPALPSGLTVHRLCGSKTARPLIRASGLLRKDPDFIKGKEAEAVLRQEVENKGLGIAGYVAAI